MSEEQAVEIEVSEEEIGNIPELVKFSNIMSAVVDAGEIDNDSLMTIAANITRSVLTTAAEKPACRCGNPRHTVELAGQALFLLGVSFGLVAKEVPGAPEFTVEEPTEEEITEAREYRIEAAREAKRDAAQRAKGNIIEILKKALSEPGGLEKLVEEGRVGVMEVDAEQARKILGEDSDGRPIGMYL